MSANDPAVLVMLPKTSALWACFSNSSSISSRRSRAASSGLELCCFVAANVPVATQFSGGVGPTYSEPSAFLHLMRSAASAGAEMNTASAMTARMVFMA